MDEEKEFSLSDSAKEVFESFIDTVIHRVVPEESRPPMEEVIKEMEKYIGGMPPLYRFGVSAMLKLLDIGPLVMGFRKQFSNLPPEDQETYLRKFENHTNYAPRAMMLGLKGMLMIVYFSFPSMEQAIGYDHSCLLSK